MVFKGFKSSESIKPLVKFVARNIAGYALKNNSKNRRVTPVILFTFYNTITEDRDPLDFRSLVKRAAQFSQDFTHA